MSAFQALNNPAATNAAATSGGPLAGRILKVPAMPTQVSRFSLGDFDSAGRTSWYVWSPGNNRWEFDGLR
jgi:hypothetical protein